MNFFYEMLYRPWTQWRLEQQIVLGVIVLVGVFLVFGKVEAHAADLPPQRRVLGEEGLKSAPRRCLLAHPLVQ